MIDFRPIQQRLGLKVDGVAGPATWSAILSGVGGRTKIIGDIAKGFVDHAKDFGILDNSERLIHVLGQCATESGGFLYTREIWGPTDAQKRYDAPTNTLGNKPGDGYDFRGGGLIEVTGRYWFDRIGHAIGIDLASHPEMSGDPTIAVLISLQWWKMNSANVVADMGDVLAMSRLVNCGSATSKRQPNGLAQRISYTNRARKVIQ